MDLNLKGKSALITGSSKGIGRAIAGLLHEEGCRIALNGRDANQLAMAISEIPGAIGISGDVTEPTVAKRIIDEVISLNGGIDVLICNVGSGRSVPPGCETFEEWHRTFACNLWSVTNILEAAQSSLAKSKGAVVCVSSICGSEVIPGAPVTYSSAKAALNAYVRGVARPLGKKGIRINAVAPGNIIFDGSVWSKRLKEDPQAVKSMLDRDVSLGRFGTPEDVANLVAFLVSSKSSFATGQIWTIDGGQTHS